MWVAEDVRLDHGGERWLNAITLKHRWNEREADEKLSIDPQREFSSGTLQPTLRASAQAFVTT